MARNRFLVRIQYSIHRNKRLLTLIAIAIVVINLFLYNYHPQPIVEFDDVYEGTFRGKYLKTIKSVEQLHSDEFYKKWSLIGYLDDLVNEPIEDPTFENTIDPLKIIEDQESKEESFAYADLPLIEKARFYSSTILGESHYMFQDIQDTIYKDAFYTKKFINSRLKKWLKIKSHLTEEEQQLLEVNDDWFKNAVTEIKDKKLEHNLVSASEIKNALSHLKIFSSIFLKPQNDNQVLYSENHEEFDGLCSKSSAKLFPWLNGVYPQVTKYDHQMKRQNIDVFSQEESSCFIKSLQTSLKGKGIVITSNDGLIPELSGLMALLRVSLNPYPIYIVHNNDLSLESIKTINDIAIEPVMKLPKAIPELKHPKNIPPLDVVFMDVSKTISLKYKKYFSHFGMKLLAYLFNPFEEMIMLDTDTVIVDNIEQFFESPQYKDTHAFFFRDRDVNSFLYEGLMDYFKSFLNYDREVHYLQLPRVGEEVLNNRFFGSFARHFMESGLFAINKKEKFDGVIAATMVQMFKLFSGSLHGEKEFIWLGQEMMGNSYTFNSNPAIAIGELSPDRGAISKELCTTHPAHVDEELDLLWFNSGFLTCKKYNSYYKDINYGRNKGKTLLEIKKEYLSPLHITHGIMPPPAEFTVAKKNGEPIRGWTMTQECSNYMWCAYDIIGGEEVEGMNLPKGKVINFSPQDTNKWDYLGRLWVNYFNKGYLGSSDGGYVEGDAYDELGIDKIDVFKGNSKYADDYDDEEAEDDDLDVLTPGTRVGAPKKGGAPDLEDESNTEIDPAAVDTKEEEEEDILMLVDDSAGIVKEIQEEYDGY